jgi:multiple antibiotic resistance protein
MSLWNELLNITEYVKLSIGLLAICNPLSTLPVYLALTEQFSSSQKKRTVLVSASAFVVILILFTFMGEVILQFFGITIEAFRIAGGIYLLLMAMEMIRGKSSSVHKQTPNAADMYSIGIVPLAIPLTAGPGAMSTIIVYAHRHISLAHDLLVSAVVVTVGIIFYLMLWFAPLASKMVGKAGLTVFNRFMGLIIAAIAVEFIIDGLAVHFPAWVIVTQP